MDTIIKYIFICDAWIRSSDTFQFMMHGYDTYIEYAHLTSDMARHLI